MKLNSTGSYSYSNGHYWSYDTKLTDTFKGYEIYNGTWYSATTAKHQAKLRYEYNYDITLTQCDYGDWDAEQMIKNEIDYIKNQIKTLELKRSTQKKLDTIAELTSKLELLESLVSEETEEYEYYYQIDYIDEDGYANYIDTYYNRAVVIKAVDLLNRANQCLNSNTKFIADRYRYIDGLDDSVECIEENITEALTINERLGEHYLYNKGD